MVTKTFKYNSTAGNPVSFNWTLVNNPNSVSIIGLSSTDTVELQANIEDDFYGLQFKCVVIDASGCPKEFFHSIQNPFLLEAVNDSFNIEYNTPSILDVKANDSVSSQGYIQITQDPLVGLATLQDNNARIFYTPSNNSNGYTTTLKYKLISGSSQSNEATVTIVVAPQPIDQCNVVVSIENLSFSSVSETASFNLIASGTYAPSDLLVTSNQGSVVMNGMSGSVSNLVSGTLLITAKVTNSVCNVESSSSINVEILPSPIAVDNTFTTASNTSIYMPVLANDSDPAGGVLSIVEINGINMEGLTFVDITEGRLTLVGSSISFMPNLDYTGTFYFDYKIKSSVSQKTAIAQVGVTVECKLPLITIWNSSEIMSNGNFTTNFDVLNAAQNQIVVTHNGASVPFTFDEQTHNGQVEVLAEIDNEIIVTATNSCGTRNFKVNKHFDYIP